MWGRCEGPERQGWCLPRAFWCLQDRMPTTKTSFGETCRMNLQIRLTLSYWRAFTKCQILFRKKWTIQTKLTSVLFKSLKTITFCLLLKAEMWRPKWPSPPEHAVLQTVVRWTTLSLVAGSLFYEAVARCACHRLEIVLVQDCMAPSPT